MKKIDILKILLLIVLAIPASLMADSDFPDLSKQDPEGYLVEFNYKDYPKEREKLYKFFKKEYDSEFHPVERDQIGIKFYDLDSDGEDEMLVYFENGGCCGSWGCSFYIYKKNEKKEYKPLLWGNESYDNSLTIRNIKILNTKTLGVFDIAFVGCIHSYAIWKWIGERYELAKTVEYKFENQ